MSEEESPGGLVPRQPHGLLRHRSQLLSRGRNLALDLLRPATLVCRWSDLGVRSIRWVATRPDLLELAVYGIVKLQRDWTLLWGRPDRSTFRTGSWMLGNADSSPFHECAALSRSGLLAVATWSGRTDNLVALMPLSAQKLQESDFRVILHTSYTDPARSMDFSPDGDRLAVGTLNGTVRVLDTVNGVELVCIGPGAIGPEARERYTNAVAYHPESGHSKRVNAVRYHPAGGTVLSGSRDGSASLWDDTTGSEIARYEHGSDIQAVSFTRGGTRVLTAGTDSLIRCWDVQRSSEVTRIPAAVTVTALAVSPGDRWLAWGSSSGELGVWDLERSRECGRAELDQAEITYRAVVGINFLDSRHLIALFASGAIMRVRIRAASEAGGR